VSRQIGEAGQEILPVVMEGRVEVAVETDGVAGLQGAVAFRPGLEKEDRWQELKGPQDFDDLAEAGKGFVTLFRTILRLQEDGDLPVETFLFQEGEEPSRGMEEEGEEGNGAAGFRDDPADLPAEAGQPGGDLSGVADGGRQEQQVDPDGKVDHDLLPDHPPVAVAQVMGLVEDHQFAVQVFPAVHGVVELVAEDLRGPHDDRGVGVVLQIAGEDADPVGAEDLAEFRPFGITQGLEGRGVPAAAAAAGDDPDGLFGDPGLPRPGGGGDDAVPLPDRRQGLELEGIRLEGPGVGPADPGESGFQHRIGLGLHMGLPGAVRPGFTAPRSVGILSR